jgi:catechol 2,3-dioxygenase-like lactoylglutathione lyase family enzyme
VRNTLGLNHVSVSADDLAESVAFYEEVFGLERLPSPNFGLPVQWLRAGPNQQLHLFEQRGTAPRVHHFGLTVDDLVPVYENARERDCFDRKTFSGHLVELPGDTAQLYLRDPAGNLVEVNFQGASRLPDWLREEMVRLEDVLPQTEHNLAGRLPLAEPGA